MGSKADRDNHSNQLNPNNDAYYSSRGISRSGGDDDDDGGASAGWSYRQATTYAPTTSQTLEYRFRLTAVAVDGRVLRAELAILCSPFFEYDRAAERAEGELLGKGDRLLKGPLAYYEVRDDKGALLRASRAPHWRIHRHKGDVTESLVRRMQTTVGYRAQAKQAASQYAHLVEQCRAFCEALPALPPAGSRKDDWQQLRDDLANRFRRPEGVTYLDVQAASAALASAGYAADGLPHPEQLKSLARRHSVLWRASLHRAPPPDPNVLDCTGRAPDVYRDYFEESRAKYQLEQLIQWFDKGAPAVQRHLADVESGADVAYDRWLPLDTTSSSFY
jgi:hypothetical protein